MKSLFLPKELNGIKNKRACVHLESGETVTKPHWHDCVEIIFMKKGATRVFFNSAWHTLEEGDMLFIPPSSIHCCECADKKSERIVVGFYSELICDRYSDEFFSLFPFYNQKMENHCIIRSSDLKGAFHRLSSLSALCVSKKEGDTVLIYSEIIGLYAEILGYWKSRDFINKNFAKNPRAIEIEEYIREHSAEAITAESTARALNISYSYMAKLLSESIGNRFSNLLLSCRVDMAKKMLTSTDKSITEIGFECGFCATSAFIQSFKKMTQTTPLAYRKSTLKKL